MSIYTYDGDKISTAALFASLGHDRDAQQIESGCYKRVFVWVENTERKPGNAQILKDFRRV